MQFILSSATTNTQKPIVSSQNKKTIEIKCMYLWKQITSSNYYFDFFPPFVSLVAAGGAMKGINVFPPIKGCNT